MAPKDEQIEDLDDVEAQLEGDEPEDQQDEEPVEGDEPDGSEGDSEGQGEGGEPQDEFSVNIGEEEPEVPRGPAPKWVKDMRRENRELKKQLRQVRQTAQAPVQPVQPVVVGEKPKLEDFEYDTEKFEQALQTWYDKKRLLDEQAAKQKAEADAQAQRWQGRTGLYAQRRGALGAEDFDDAEATVANTLSTAQQSIIIAGANDPALLVYALGKNPARAKALATITDPVEFAFAAARLEAQLKVSGKKPATAPESRVTGNGRVAGGSDATLARLRAEAEKTQDYTKVIAYKRSLKKRS